MYSEAFPLLPPDSFYSKVQYFHFPWPYLVVDDFLPNHLLTQLNDLEIDPVSADSFRVHKNYLSKTGKLNLTVIPPKLALSIHAACFPTLISCLSFLNPAKVSLYDYTELHLVQTGSSFQFPIHHDLRAKLLSVVVYLAPLNSSGTHLYSQRHKQSLARVIDWKVNRSLIFSRIENTTWHSYRGSDSGERTALVYNLMTERPLQAAKLEGNSVPSILANDFSRYFSAKLSPLAKCIHRII